MNKIGLHMRHSGKTMCTLIIFLFVYLFLFIHRLFLVVYVFHLSLPHWTTQMNRCYCKWWPRIEVHTLFECTTSACTTPFHSHIYIWFWCTFLYHHALALSLSRSLSFLVHFHCPQHLVLNWFLFPFAQVYMNACMCLWVMKGE